MMNLFLIYDLKLRVLQMPWYHNEKTLIKSWNETFKKNLKKKC